MAIRPSRRRAQVVEREPRVGEALAAGPADLREAVRDRLGQHDVARPRDEPPAERRPRRRPRVERDDRGPGDDLARAGGRGRPDADRATGTTGRRAPRPGPDAPSQPGRSPSSSTTRVPSWMVTPRSRAARRRPRARMAGWMVAAPGMNAPARSTGERDPGRDLVRASARRSGPPPRAPRTPSVASSQLPSWAGAALTDSEPAFVYQASTPCSAHQRPSSSTAASIAHATSSAPGLAVALDERRHLVPPARHEPAVATGRPAAADVRLEERRSVPRGRAPRGGARSTARCSRRRGSRRRP